MKNLNLQDIIEILSEKEIVFKAEIVYLGQDTDFKCIEFTIQDEKLYNFDYYLDVSIHGHTIRGGKNGWFYSPKNFQQFMEFLEIGHIK